MVPRKPVRSPIQRRQLPQQNSLEQLLKNAAEFPRMYQEMMAARDEILGTLSTIQKGERGVQGLPGIGRDGKNGRDGRDGAPGRNGLPGKDGLNGISPRVEDIIKVVRKKKLKTEDVDGLDQTLHAFKTQLDNRGGYIHGGGDTVGAGSNIVITEVNGVKIISSTASGSTLTAEIPVGAVNGVNTIYTVTHTPVFVQIDGQFRVDGYGYTYLAGTITVDPLTPPSQSIVSFYNA